jgi:hypothetical protein
MTSKYDLIIVGGGPIASVASYVISQNKTNLNLEKIALIQKEPNVEPYIAYLNAGGSVRWYFEDEEMSQITKKTADFIQNIKDKVDLNLVEDNYFFVHKGIFVKSYNIAGSKLVNYLKNTAKENGIDIISDTEFIKINSQENGYILKTNKGDFQTKKVIFCLGYKNKEIFNLPLEIEKRQLFVLDININQENINLPHTIIKFKEGIVYFFIKKFDYGYRLLLGQEEIFEHSLEPKEENYFQDLLKLGLVDYLPFLKNANVEKILWGFDVKNKKPIINEIYPNVYTVNCGSAVRSIVHIGEQVYELFKNKV